MIFWSTLAIPKNKLLQIFKLNSIYILYMAGIFRRKRNRRYTPDGEPLEDVGGGGGSGLSSPLRIAIPAIIAVIVLFVILSSSIKIVDAGHRGVLGWSLERGGVLEVADQELQECSCAAANDYAERQRGEEVPTAGKIHQGRVPSFLGLIGGRKR